MNGKWNVKYILAIIGLILTINLFNSSPAFAQDITNSLPGVNIQINNGDGNNGTVTTLQMMFLITIISLAPSILLMMTSFTRILISLHFLRSGLGTQQMPPNQILVGITLFLTLFLMSPTLQQVNETAIKPLADGSINQETALKNAMIPFREFMFRQVDDADISLFIKLAALEPYENEEDAMENLPNSVLIPAFILTELKYGFLIGFLIYIPFIVIDMIVASVLMAMGMMMLPPSMISLPFKIMFFVMVNGWDLFIGSLINTFR